MSPLDEVELLACQLTSPPTYLKSFMVKENKDFVTRLSSVCCLLASLPFIFSYSPSSGGWNRTLENGNRMNATTIAPPVSTFLTLEIYRFTYL